MILKGKKVLLRAVEYEDISFLRDMINDPELEKNVVGWSFPISNYSQEQWYKNIINNKNEIRYIIEANGERIGMASYHDIDWKNKKAIHAIKLCNKDFRGKGYGTDVVMTMMKYAFEELGLNRLYGSIIDYNVASQNLYFKCGWKIEGTYRNSVYKNNKFHDEIAVGILKIDYEKLLKEKINNEN